MNRMPITCYYWTNGRKYYMNECEKLFLKINKKHLVASAIITTLFTAAGGGWLPAAIIYMLSVEICALNFLRAKGLANENGDGVNMQPAERRDVYQAYIKMMLLHSAVFALVFAAGTEIGKSGSLTAALLKRLFANETPLSAAGQYAFLGALAVLALSAMSGFVLKSSSVKRFLLLSGTVYCPILFEVVYLLFLTLAQLAPDVYFAHRVFALSGAAAFVISAAVFAVSAKRNFEKFTEE